MINQSTISFNSKDKLDLMIEAFLKAGIPLHVFRNEHFSKWMGENCKISQTFPSETSEERFLVFQTAQFH